MKFSQLLLTFVLIVSTFNLTTSQLTDSNITTTINKLKINHDNDDNYNNSSSEFDESTLTVNQPIISDTFSESESTELPDTKSTLNYDSESNHDNSKDLESFTESESESESITESASNETNPESEVTITTNNSNDEESISESDAEEDNYKYHVNHINQTIELLNRWAKITENAIQMIVSEAMPHATEFGYRFDINENCILSLLQLVNGFRKQKAWAFKLIDSYGRPAPGSLDGTINSLGDYEECLGIEFPRYFGEETSITGKYCTIKIDFPVPVKPNRVKFHDHPKIQLNGTHLNETIWGYMVKYLRTAYTVRGFRFGVCIPSTCSADELEPIIRKAASPILAMPLTFGPDDECTYRSEVIPLTIYSKISLTFFTIIISIVVTSTILDTLLGLATPTRSNQQFTILSLIVKFISCFSVHQANQYLAKSSQTIRVNKICNGLTVLTLWSLIAGHTYFFGAFYKTSEFINRWTEDLPASVGKTVHQIFLNTHLFMDSLFFISGVSLGCLILPKLSSTKWFVDYAILVLSRWLRFVPLIAAVILINYLFPHLGSGPDYKSHVYQIIDNCQTNWWPHFLAIGNWYGNVDTMCAPQLWYLSADLQLHLIAIIIFIGYQRNTQTGLMMNIIIIIVGIASSAISNLYFNYDATFGLDHLVDYESLHHQFDSTYFPTYLHLSPFALGILIGRMIESHTGQKKSFKMTSIPSIFIGITSLGLTAIAMFTSVTWNDSNVQFDLNISSRALFVGLQRTFWCSFLAWVTFSFTLNGKTNFFLNTLTSDFFSVLSRLSFCIYVIHTIPIDLRTYSFKYTKLWDDHFFISWSLLNVVSSIAIGYMLFLLLEFPMIQLINLIIKSDKSGQLDAGQSVNVSKFRFTSKITRLSARKNGKFEINPRV